MPRSLYDRYQLSNSTAIPLYQGSNGREGLQVAAFQQGRYDQAQAGANDVFAGTLAMKAMSKDQVYADEMVAKAKGSIDDWSRKGDWENQVEGVRSLGREYAQRANELAAPLKQYQEWEDKELENKEKNLTPFQKNVLKSKALENYGGLKKDNYGRLVGSFKGNYVAKNIDVPAWVDEKIKGFIAAEGGTDVSNDNGIIKYRRGNSWVSLSKERIQQMIGSAAATDPEFQAFVSQEGEIAGYAGAKSADPSKLDPVTLKNIEAHVAQGYSPQQAMEIELGNTRKSQIANAALNYGIQKYAHYNSKSVREDGLGAVETAARIKALEDKEGSAIITTDTLDNVATNWKDLDKSTTEAKTSKEGAMQEIARMKNTVGRATPGWNKMSPNEQEAAINSYYKNLPGGSTLLTQLQSYRNQAKGADETIRKINEAKDFIDAFVYDKLGTSKDQVNKDMKNGLESILLGMGDKTVNFFGGPGQPRQSMKASELAALVKGATFEKAGSTFGINSVKFRTADGRIINLQDNAITGKLDTQVTANSKFGKATEAEIEKYRTEAMENYSHSTGIVVVNNENFNKTMHNTLRASEKVIYNAAGQPVKPGSDEDKEVQAMINDGGFDYIGTYTENKGKQGSMAKVSVKNPNDPKAVGTTYRVGITRTLTNDLIAQKLIDGAVDRDGTIKYPDMYNAGMALKPNSAYNKINRTKIGTVATVKERVPSGKGFTYKVIGQVEKGRIDGQPSIIVKDQDGNVIPGLTDQMQIGAFLQQYENNPNYKVEF